MDQTVLYVFVVLTLFFVEANFAKILAKGVSKNESKQILALHNALRLLIQNGKVANQPRSKNMRELSWDKRLAAAAQEVANDMKFEHQIKKDYRWIVGQNLEQTRSTKPYITDAANWHKAINRWFNEVQRYVYVPYGYNLINDTGHYTQLIWAETTHVGCGYAYYVNSTKIIEYRKLYVCNYGPAGNVVGKLPYEIKECGCKSLCKTKCIEHVGKDKYDNNVEYLQLLYLYN